VLESDAMSYLLLLDVLVLGGFVLRAWQLEAKANQFLRQPAPGMPFTSLHRPDHFVPQGESHRRRANSFAIRGFVVVCCYLIIRAAL
jgi:hypothetical protein